MKFDETTNKATKLAHITDNWVQFMLSKSKSFFYVLDGGNVWKFDLLGKKMSKIVDGEGKITNYKVSPDETMIAYQIGENNSMSSRPTQTNQYVLNLSTNTILTIPLNKLIEANPEYNSGDVYMLGEWLDNETILKNTNGSPGFTWNMKSNTFGSDSPYVQMHNKWGSTRVHLSPNKQYQAVFTNNGVVVYDDKDTKVFDQYDYNKFKVTEYQGIGWTPDSRFYIFEMDRIFKSNNSFTDAIAVIDIENRKTYQYSLDLLAISDKDIQMHFPYYGGSSVIENGRVYFIASSSNYIEYQKNIGTSQAWVFNLSSASFEKIGDVKVQSDGDFSHSSLFWIK